MGPRHDLKEVIACCRFLSAWYTEEADVHSYWQVVFLELCSERRGILTMTKQEVGSHCHPFCLG